jgi:hypothetical protein
MFEAMASAPIVVERISIEVIGVIYAAKVEDY